MPPRSASLLLIHGAASGPWVFRDWPASFPDAIVWAVDLQEGADVGTASMRDYAGRVEAAAVQLPRPLALCGWSMGGLVALMAAEGVQPAGLVLLEPSPPAEVQGSDPGSVLTTGTFSGEEAYGAFPPGVASRPESALARAERKRGIPVPAIPCPSLVVYGDEFADTRGRPVARLYGSEEAYFPGFDHWDLVLSPRVRDRIASFLSHLAGTGAKRRAQSPTGESGDPLP